ncbi:MAG TPA: hypothetical protein VFZ61_33830 [Polyangiales bacterium]
MSTATPHIVFDEDDQHELSSVLQGLRAVMARHPIAFQAAYSALVREGRAYAASEQGEAAKEALRGSQLLSASRLVWRTLSMGAFTESPHEVLPSTYLDAMLRAGSLAQLEPTLSRLFDPKEP